MNVRIVPLVIAFVLVIVAVFLVKKPEWFRGFGQWCKSLFTRSSTTPSGSPTSPRYSNLFNPFSGTLMAIMVSCVLVGGYMLYHGNFWGFIPFIVGVLFGMGFKQPEPSPRRVWLLTCFGKKTETAVDGLTLLLDWLPLKVIGHVEFLMERKDQTFKVEKSIKCLDGYVTGELAISIMPDERDDPEPTTEASRGRRFKNGRQKLADFDNSGGNKDIKLVFEQIDDILTAWVQYFARSRKVEWMEVHGLELAAFLLPRIEGILTTEELKSQIPESINDDEMRRGLEALCVKNINDARGLGIHFFKFTCNFKADQKVIDARNRLLVENADRESELCNTETMNRKIAARVLLHRQGIKDPETGVVYKDAPDKQPTFKQVRDDLLMEDLEEEGKVEAVINPNGITINELRQQRNPR